MSDQTQALTTKNEECALVFPSNAPTGFEEIDMTDLPIPRLRLVQAMSKSFKAGVAKLGQFENSITQEVKNGPVELVPIRIKRGALYMEKGKGFVCKSEDGITNFTDDLCEQCPQGQYWKTWKDGNPPLCGATVDMVVVQRDTLLERVPTVMMLTFTKTSHKVGQTALSMMYATGKPIYARAFALSSFEDKKTKGEYMNYVVKPSSYLTQDEFNVAIKLVERFQNRKLNVDDQSLHHDSPQAPRERSEAPPVADDF